MNITYPDEIDVRENDHFLVPIEVGSRVLNLPGQSTMLDLPPTDIDRNGLSRGVEFDRYRVISACRGRSQAEEKREVFI
ncbi:hypothetical protein [Trinickia soli]|uniref:hypothetical protein n=1 Tax=Trinickia soli TaxID=380675 RepID=UPI0011AF8D06|nr:hypothetical protein [Trinickia soli]